MEQFTPYTALAGGALIGFASSWLMLGNGRIAGISGIVGGLLRAGATDRAWRGAFVTGLVLGPLLLRAAGYPLPDLSPQAGTTGLIVAGLLVGVGTRLGGGCTSGHGVCGLSRLSRRSLVATATFMASAMLTVFLTRHVFGG